jgi:hypothetical protein
MKTKSTFLPLMAICVTLALIFSPTDVFAQLGDNDKVAQSGGDWPGITWDPSGDPGSGDHVHIGGDINGAFSVDYNDSDSSVGVTRINVGSSVGGFEPNGELTISAGTLTANGGGSIAVRVGFSDDSTGVLNMTGGVLETTSASGGWLTLGAGVDSHGTVNLSGGEMIINRIVSLGFATGSTGILNVTGGSLLVSGDNANNIALGRNANNTTSSGVLTQSAGTISVTGNFQIGNATAATRVPTGTATLTGGITSVDGNIVIGNTASGEDGEGSLLVGPNANLSTTGTGSVLTLGGNSELGFLLGSNDSFNAIDLTATTSGPSLSFLEDSLISIDGSNLPFGLYDPINLITYSSGQGPTSTSLSNIGYSFIDFDPGLTTELEWTDTSLVLTVIPEPSTVALFMGVAVLGCVGVARRRRMSVSN